MRRWTGLVAGVCVVLLAACASARGVVPPRASRSVSATPAPDFTLTDQFGHRQTLSNFRGRTVLLTFVDSTCTTICPLTAQLMWQAKQDVGARRPVELLAVNANPRSTSVSAVRRWSVRHRMLRRWLFLTGSPEELRSVWRSYGIEAKVVHGEVDHTAVIYLIDPAGRVRAAFPIAERSGIGAEARTIADAVQAAAA
ncbi:MAG TPA: SCO family protein [Actinomycetota bacterium]|nr:SCO family protein [Actinomycetota bacterium]